MTKRATKILLTSIVAIVALFAILGVVKLKQSERRKSQQVILELLRIEPRERFEIIAFGSNDSGFGKGDSVVVFRVGNNNLEQILNSAGFFLVSAEPGRSDLDFGPVNRMLRILANSTIAVGPDYSTFVRELNSPVPRVYYDKKEDVAVIVTGKGVAGRGSPKGGQK